MRTDGLPDAPTRLPDITHDAVVVIPGIMGSELRDRASDQPAAGNCAPTAPTHRTWNPKPCAQDSATSTSQPKSSP